MGVECRLLYYSPNSKSLISKAWQSWTNMIRTCIWRTTVYANATTAATVLNVYPSLPLPPFPHPAIKQSPFSSRRRFLDSFISQEPRHCHPTCLPACRPSRLQWRDAPVGETRLTQLYLLSSTVSETRSSQSHLVTEAISIISPTVNSLGLGYYPPPPTACAAPRACVCACVCV